MRSRNLAIAMVLLLGCKSEPPKLPNLAETMPNIPLPPEAQLVSRSGGEDALQLRFKSVEPLEQVAEYYREFFSKGAWRLVSDTKMADSVVAMYAEGSAAPLWVTIRRAPGANGSLIDLVGAKIPRKP